MNEMISSTDQQRLDQALEENGVLGLEEEGLSDIEIVEELIRKGEKDFFGLLIAAGWKLDRFGNALVKVKGDIDRRMLWNTYAHNLDPEWRTYSGVRNPFGQK